MKKTIYIFRHGQTDLNKNAIVQGSGVDAGLNDTGRAQAAGFFEAYQHVGFEVVLTSALRRTHETVEPFLNAGLPWVQFPEINEISWGAHEGKKSTPEMISEYRSVIGSWKSGDYSASVTGGESAHDLSLRLNTFVDHLKNREEEKILVCCHGRAMRCLMCLLKGLPLDQMEQFHHANTGLWRMEYEKGQFLFDLENDTTHLPPVE